MKEALFVFLAFIFLCEGTLWRLYCVVDESEGSVLNVEKSSFQIKKTSSFGLDITYAEHSITFDNEIGITLPIVCPAYDCANQDAIDLDCVCNYASKDPEVCGIVPGGCEPCDMNLCKM